ncbi:hypothetical protein [Pseudoalteromonas sp.]|uniref:hypothetical protein n=1 Tax=Pseudoalteromonas sp. TaxID=53249 RepID=UPI00356955EC
MKIFLMVLALASTLVIASEEQASVETVKDSYEFCLDMAADEENKDNAVLFCVNDELKSLGYKPFDSLQAIKSYIKAD